MSGRIDRRHKVAHRLEILGHRGQFSRIPVTQCDGETCREADSWPLNDRFEFTQPGRAGAISELCGGLQADHFGRELPTSAAFSAADNKTVIASVTPPWLAATHARARLRS